MVKNKKFIKREDVLNVHLTFFFFTDIGNTGRFLDHSIKMYHIFETTVSL